LKQKGSLDQTVLSWAYRPVYGNALPVIEQFSIHLRWSSCEPELAVVASWSLEDTVAFCCPKLDCFDLSPHAWRQRAYVIWQSRCCTCVVYICV